MKKFFIAGSTYSMMRLLSFIAVISAIVCIGFVITFSFLKYEISYIREIIYLTSIILGFGFGGKAVQKFTERKNLTDVK